MKKRAVSMLLTAVMAVTGMAATATVAHAEGEEGKVIIIRCISLIQKRLIKLLLVNTILVWVDDPMDLSSVF